MLDQNRLPAGIRGWVGTATGGHIHVVHISHTHPPKELIQALRKDLLGKKIDERLSPVNAWSSDYSLSAGTRYTRQKLSARLKNYEAEGVGLWAA